MEIYRPADRPDVEVLVDGTWWPGELRGTWTRDGRNLANVQYRTAPSETRLETVSADRVREV